MTGSDISMTAPALLRQLIAFDTTSHLSNLALVDFVTGLMDLAMQLVFGVCTGVWCIAQ